MTEEKPVTPAQAAHDEELRLHRNGAINLAKRIPDSGEKTLGPWRVPAPEDGPGMYRYSETPRVTAEERRQMEPPPTAERRQLEPWNFPTPEPEVTDAKAAKLATLADTRAETEQGIAQRQERGNGHAR